MKYCFKRCGILVDKIVINQSEHNKFNIKLFSGDVLISENIINRGYVQALDIVLLIRKGIPCYQKEN